MCKYLYIYRLCSINCFPLLGWPRYSSCDGGQQQLVNGVGFLTMPTVHHHHHQQQQQQQQQLQQQQHLFHHHHQQQQHLINYAAAAVASSTATGVNENILLSTATSKASTQSKLSSPSTQLSVESRKPPSQAISADAAAASSFVNAGASANLSTQKFESIESMGDQHTSASSSSISSSSSNSSSPKTKHPAYQQQVKLNKDSPTTGDCQVSPATSKRPRLYINNNNNNNNSDDETSANGTNTTSSSSGSGNGSNTTNQTWLISNK